VLELEKLRILKTRDARRLTDMPPDVVPEELSEASSIRRVVEHRAAVAKEKDDVLGLEGVHAVRPAHRRIRLRTREGQDLMDEGEVVRAQQPEDGFGVLVAEAGLPERPPLSKV